MSYTVVALFEVIPGMTDEELSRTRLALEILQQQPGFLSYESVRTDEGNVMVIQGLQSQEDYQHAISLARQRRAERQLEGLPRGRGGVLGLKALFVAEPSCFCRIHFREGKP